MKKKTDGKTVGQENYCKLRHVLGIYQVGNVSYSTVTNGKSIESQRHEFVIDS
jgi:hypothetical protein